MICGIDEAGRGPLAGPVCAAAVILPEDFPREGLGDSKKLKPSSRDRARRLIFARALAWGIGWASPAEIDRLNILKASLLAMERAFEALKKKARVWEDFLPLEAVVDGLYVPPLSVPAKALVKADSLIPEVMVASILAKTARDRLMETYSIFYPEYGYEKHKGYPTQAHRTAILRHGPSPIQRVTFRVKE